MLLFSCRLASARAGNDVTPKASKVARAVRFISSPFFFSDLARSRVHLLFASCDCTSLTVPRPRATDPAEKTVEFPPQRRTTAEHEIANFGERRRLAAPTASSAAHNRQVHVPCNRIWHCAAESKIRASERYSGRRDASLPSRVILFSRSASTPRTQPV